MNGFFSIARRRCVAARAGARSNVAYAALLVLTAASGAQATADPRYFDQGTPVVLDIWVDPLAGNDANSGATRLSAVETLSEAWGRVPMATTLTGNGYRIRLVAGTYPQAEVPLYFESRYATYAFPVIIEAADGPGTARLPALNIFDCRYLYLVGLHISALGGDVLHCEQCDHFLVREVTVRGAAPETFAVQEAVKVNQSQYVYIEDSDISGAWDNAVDFVAVQYGHVQGNRIHDAGDWCLYTKGGSAGFRIESNEFYDSANGGYTAGQGTGFEFMTSPWLHYEAYDIRFVNNIIRDTQGAGFGVNGGYNILLAYNTLYRVGAVSHVLEFVFGSRSCDGDTARCSAGLAAGGWGTTSGSGQPIPNRNVFAYNNVVYNPGVFRSAWQQLAIYGPQTPAPSSNIPSPARTDTNLQLRGNVIWNGPISHPLGVEDPGAGCQPLNPTCNAAQLLADNAINVFEPEFVDAGAGDFAPLPAGNLYSAVTYALAPFPGGDAPSPPTAPPGDLANSVTRDFSGAPRGPASPPGAFGADCSSAVCGDATFDMGCEQCDDGNAVDGDGCDSNCTVTACGNAIVTSGEVCDDGDGIDGDGCDRNCTVTACGNSVVSSGEQCDDGNVGSGDGCSAMCVLDCPLTPPATCHTQTRAHASKLRIVDADGTTRDGIKWKLKAADSTTPATFGDPLGSTGYVLCLYGTAVAAPSLVIEAVVPSSAECGERDCWTRRGPSGYRYRSDVSGRVEVILTAKAGGVGDVSVTTKGAAGFVPALPLAQDPAVTVQLRSGQGQCWGAVFNAPAPRNDAGLFKDSSD